MIDIAVGEQGRECVEIVGGKRLGEALDDGIAGGCGCPEDKGAVAMSAAPEIRVLRRKKASSIRRLSNSGRLPLVRLVRGVGRVGAMREPPWPGRTIRSSRAGAGAGDHGRFSSGLRSLVSVKPSLAPGQADRAEPRERLFVEHEFRLAVRRARRAR